MFASSHGVFSVFSLGRCWSLRDARDDGSGVLPEREAAVYALHMVIKRARVGVRQHHTCAQLSHWGSL